MSFLKIALLQAAPCTTEKENLEKGLEYCRRAKEMGADIALFPKCGAAVMTAWAAGAGKKGR